MLLNMLLVVPVDLPAVPTYDGIATMYGDARHYGRPLYCDRADNYLHYSAGTEPWIAVDVGEYTSGRVKCGDMMLIVDSKGRMLVAKAYDAGYLRKFSHYVSSTHFIVVDVPVHLATFAGTSRAVVYNISALERSRN